MQKCLGKYTLWLASIDFSNHNAAAFRRKNWVELCGRHMGDQTFTTPYIVYMFDML